MEIVLGAIAIGGIAGLSALLGAALTKKEDPELRELLWYAEREKNPLIRIDFMDDVDQAQGEELRRIDRRIKKLENKIGDVKKIQGIARKNQSRLDKMEKSEPKLVPEGSTVMTGGVMKPMCSCGFVAKNQAGLKSHQWQVHGK